MRPLIWLRVGVRVVSLSAMTLICLKIWLIGVPFTRRSAASRSRWRNAHLRRWSRGALRVIGCRVTAFGSPPEPPFLLVANHLSYVDVAVLGSLVQGTFVSKSEVADWPLLGRATKTADPIFVDRRSQRSIPHALERIDELLERGGGVLLFPEGTSSPGAEVLPFYSPLLAHAARNRFPVSYAALSYRTPSGEEPAHLSVCWWGEMTLVGHIVHLLTLPRFHATIVFGNDTICDSDRKRLARRLRDAVAEQFEPVVPAEELCA